MPDAAATPALPAGDQHVSLLAQEIDDVVSAQILLKRCLNQDRSNAEAVNAANVLSDNYDRLCAHLCSSFFGENIGPRPLVRHPISLSRHKIDFMTSRSG
jgi:hypothetical protein